MLGAVGCGSRQLFTRAYVRKTREPSRRSASARFVRQRGRLERHRVSFLGLAASALEGAGARLALRRRVRGGAEAPPPVASLRLDRVHGRVGPLEKVRRALAVVGKSAMPMLAERPRLPSSGDGTHSRNARRIFSAAISASRGLSMPGSRATNSSPPRRATVSLARSASRRRTRQLPCSTRSPAACPCVSFTSLNLSRSR